MILSPDGIGWDQSEKDGLYIFRIQILEKFLKTLNWNCNYIFCKDLLKENKFICRKIFHYYDKVEHNNKFLDLIVLDANLDGKLGSWKFD